VQFAHPELHLDMQQGLVGEVAALVASATGVDETLAAGTGTCAGKQGQEAQQCLSRSSRVAFGRRSPGQHLPHHRRDCEVERQRMSQDVRHDAG
jgi:hypothetical protein